MSKDHLDFDYASHHLILSSKFFKKLTIDPKIQIVKKKREKHSLKSTPLINSSIHALTKSVGCGTILSAFCSHHPTDIHVLSSYCFTLLLYPYMIHPPSLFSFFLTSQFFWRLGKWSEKSKKIKRERGSERKTSSTLVKDQENMKVGGGLTTVVTRTEGREAVRSWVYLRSL